MSVGISRCVMMQEPCLCTNSMGSSMVRIWPCLLYTSPLVALYTVAAECGTVPGVACGAAAVLSLLFAGAPMQAASMVFFTRFQNIALMVAAVLAGYAYRTHVAYVRAVEQRAAEAERSASE